MINDAINDAPRYENRYIDSFSKDPKGLPAIINFLKTSVNTVMGKAGAINCIAFGICEMGKKTPPPRNMRNTMAAAIPIETSPLGEKTEINRPRDK
jgi:hypothetical protein